ncbi:MAG: hypothetical protein V2I45_06305 [Halieaceae bacterium]|jgi:Flp pilus assembly protein TadD|nr:hypothetical protein [Halieaceae bacterium]
MNKSIRTIALLVAGLSFATPTLASDAMELKTADREVLGTRDIEAGHFSQGIVKLERALQHANHSFGRAPALINLCVAHAALGELDKADRYCNEAVETGIDAGLAYNNRAVVNCLRGRLDACVGDLEKAGQIQPRNPVVQRNIQRLRSKKQVAANS